MACGMFAINLSLLVCFTLKIVIVRLVCANALGSVGKSEHRLMTRSPQGANNPEGTNLF